MGVDRLSLSFPVTSFDPYRFRSEGANRHADGGATVLRRFAQTISGEGIWSGSTVMLGVLESPRGWVGKLECNPSRWIDPSGFSLIDPHALHAVVDQVLPAMLRLQQVETASPVGEWRVKRVDLARDFRGVAVPAVTIEGLRTQRRKYARFASVHHDPALGGAQTLTVGTKARLVRLYDQAAAYPDKGAQPGDVRWEAQLRAEHLKPAGVTTLRHLTPAKVHSLAMAAWEWSKCGVTLGHRESAVSAVDSLVRSGSLSPAKAQRLLGQMVAESHGVAWVSSRKTVTEYERWKATLGVSAGADPFQENGTLREARLDWETGLELSP